MMCSVAHRKAYLHEVLQHDGTDCVLMVAQSVVDGY